MNQTELFILVIDCLKCLVKLLQHFLQYVTVSQKKKIKLYFILDDCGNHVNIKGTRFANEHRITLLTIPLYYSDRL